MLQITVDSHIRIPNLTDEWREGLARFCSFKNEEKERALKEHVWGASKLDDLYTLAKVENNILILPRGFYGQLRDMLDDNDIGYDINWEVSTHEQEGILQWATEKSPKLSKEQAEALTATQGHFQGRIIAPPGKGKTVIGLYSIFSQSNQGIILVDKKHIAQQWVDRAEEHFGREIGFIGDNKWEEKDISVALLQTLHSRKHLLAEEWWDKWDMMILDEQHHIPAETYTDVVERFPAFKRFGFSATIGKTESKKKISELIFGPIIYESKTPQINPTVKTVNTKFEFEYVPTHKVRTSRNTTKVVRNNYQRMMKFLVNDPDRNQLIADKVCALPKGAHLVISNRLSHLESIKGIVEHNSDIPCRMLTGKEPLDERMEIYEWADEGGCAVFSTLGVAGEALDIPRLDVGHLTFPVKNEETLWQIVGRVARTHDDKVSATFYDYVDVEVELLYNQYKNRLRNCYQVKKLTVEVDT